MANTSSIFKGTRTKLLTKDGLGLEAGQNIKVTDGAAVGATMVSDATGQMIVTPTGADTQDPTGWVAGDGIAVTYDSGAQTVTLTGTLDYYYHGEKRSLTSPWTSPPHTNTTGNTYFLYINSSGVGTWMTNSSPGFNAVLVAFVYYGATNKFAIKEMHGLMDWQSHKTMHYTIGTYRVSGGAVTAATYALNTNTVDAVTPGVDQAVVADEDLNVIVPALTNGSTYTRLHFDTGAAVFTTGSTFPYPNDGTDIQYNQNPSAGTALTSMTTPGRYVNIYGVFVPATADAGSQAYRMVWITGQQIYTTSGAAVSEDFRTLNLGNLSTIFTEFVPYIRMTYVTANSNLTANARVAVNPTYLIGNKLSLVSVSGVTPTDHGSLSGLTTPDSHPATAISTDVTSFNNRLTSSETTVQAALAKLDDIVTPANLGGTGVANNAAATLTRSGNHALTLTTTNTTSVTLPTAGTLATLAGTETLENKTLDSAVIGGAANDGTDGFLKFKDQSSAATAATGDDTNVFAVDRKLYKRDAAGTREIGKNSDEINYIGNGSGIDDVDAAAPAGWTAVGDIAILTEKTAAGLPREITTKSALSINAVPGTQSVADYVYYDFTLDDVDANKLLQISWSQLGSTLTAGRMAVVITSQADRTTALHTPSTTTIPSIDGDFVTTFLSGSTLTLSLVIRATTDMDDGEGISISNVYVGPGTLIQGAAVGRIGSLVWTIGNWTLTSQANECWRVGNRLVGNLTVVYASGSGVLTLAPPSGYTIDSSKVPTGGNLGSAMIVDAGTVSNNKIGLVTLVSGALRVQTTDGSDVSSTNPITWASGDSIRIEFDIPITEWDSGVYLGSGADGTSVLDWTSYTPTISASTPPTRGTNTEKAYYRRVGDSLEIQYHYIQTVAGSAGSGGYTWSIPAGLAINTAKVAANSAGVGVGQASGYDGTNYWQGIAQVGSSTTVQVQVGNESSGLADVGSSRLSFGNTVSRISFAITVPIVGWTSAEYLGKMLVGFGSAGVGRSGLVNNDSSNAGGTPIKGRTDGSVASTDYVGYEIVASLAESSSTSLSDETTKTVTSIPVPVGVWDVSAIAAVTPTNASTTFSRWQAGISKTNNTMPATSTIGAPSSGEVRVHTNTNLAATNTALTQTIPPLRYVNNTGSTVTLYLVVWADFAVSTAGGFGSIRAVRVQ